MPEEEDLTEFDYIAGSLVGFCMTYIDKDMLWTILNHVQNSYELAVALETQEDLMICVEDYYEINK